ncbi:MAG: ATP-grasp domain-containing protein [Candidatus Magasanikbacteria bacterium]|nr:ATP-grasp domain-containing protein [Candidatus Magasanikbacteria bacterium]
MKFSFANFFAGWFPGVQKNPRIDTSLRGRTIILVNPGSIQKKFIWERLKELGVVVVALNDKKIDSATPYIDHWVLANTTDFSACKNAIKIFLKKHPEISPEGVLTFWDECVLLVAYLAEAFAWPGIPFKVAAKIKNKYLFREFCEKHDLPAPRFKKIKSTKSIVAASKKLQYPMVIKPVFGASSAFVIRVENETELKTASQSIDTYLADYDMAKEWVNWELFLEEYIGGDEVDIDILWQNNDLKYFSIIDNNATHEPFFVETGGHVPSRLPMNKQKALIAMATKTLKTFGVKNGCFHFEAKIDTRGPMPIEINMRMGGAAVFPFSKFTWGVDLVESAVKIALGEPLTISKPAKPLNYLVAKKILPSSSGLVTNFSIDPALEKQAYFVKLSLEKKVGDTFLTPPEGYDNCLGWLAVKGATESEADANLERGFSYITYKLKKLKKSK